MPGLIDNALGLRRPRLAATGLAASADTVHWEPHMFPGPEDIRHKVELPSALQADLLAQAHASAPYECCGILLGTPAADGRPAAVMLADPAFNQEAGQSTRRFRIAPADIAHASALARERGLEVLGFYHSHPRGLAEPSAEDVQEGSAWPGYLHLIAAPNDRPALRAFRTGATHWQELTIL